MSGKTSSFSDSLLRENSSSIHAYIPLDVHCFYSIPSNYIFIMYNITIIVLLLPLSIFILYHGLQQWCSTSSAAAISHSDSFTYHMVTMELIRVFGGILSCFGIFNENINILLVGYFLISFTWNGEILFHVLACVDRYLAVVHPITYLSLRRERGIRIRNICITCVWLLSVVGLGLAMTDYLPEVIMGLLMLFLIIMSFCSLSVLWVLIRSSAGDQVGRRERVDQSKLRAFYTIMAILGVLVLRLAWGLLLSLLHVSGTRDDCVIMMCENWLIVPSCLVLPLLFLHRTGKLVCCKNNSH